MNQKPRQELVTDKIFAAQGTDEIIALMQQEDEAAERTEIHQAMTPACREKLQYFETWLRKEVNHTLRSRYELGLHVHELYEDEKKNKGKLYGKNAIGRICKLLSWDDGIIRLALRFVQRYTPDDLERICTIVMPDGEPLTWSHVRALIPIDDNARRKELLERTVAEGWNCTELAQEIKSLADGSTHDGRGRPPREP